MDPLTGKTCLLSLDLESAGEHVGICQLSAKLTRVKLKQVKGKTNSDEAANVERTEQKFNEFVNYDQILLLQE